MCFHRLRSELRKEKTFGAEPLGVYLGAEYVPLFFWVGVRCKQKIKSSGCSEGPERQSLTVRMLELILESMVVVSLVCLRLLTEIGPSSQILGNGRSAAWLACLLGMARAVSFFSCEKPNNET